MWKELRNFLTPSWVKESTQVTQPEFPQWIYNLPNTLDFTQRECELAYQGAMNLKEKTRNLEELSFRGETLSREINVAYGDTEFYDSQNLPAPPNAGSPKHLEGWLTELPLEEGDSVRRIAQAMERCIGLVVEKSLSAGEEWLSVDSIISRGREI